MPMTFARQRINLAMKIPWVGLQHTKAVARDHGLNRAGDAIVMWLHSVS
jgi:hypothetical protein